MSRVGDWILGVPRRPPVAAAAGAVALGRPRSSGYANTPWTFGTPLEPATFDGYAPWWDREAAMSLPTISRCRDLICTACSALPFTLWTTDVSQTPHVELAIPPPSWFERPDPDRTRQWLLAWTVDDLFFYERAHWLIVNRFADSYPSAFRRICPGDLSMAAGEVTVTDADGHRTPVDPRDVIEFCSPIEGLLTNGFRAISIALALDAAADRFASVEVPAGVLEEQDGSEDMSSDELAEQVERFQTARLTNTIAATNKYLRYRETPTDASKMQLVEGRTYQALELARLGNVPPYLVGAPAGTGMTYQNALQAKGDLIDFGAGPFITCIEQTLSGPNVTPRGQHVRLDQNAWLRNPFTTAPDAVPSPNDLQDQAVSP